MIRDPRSLRRTIAAIGMDTITLAGPLEAKLEAMAQAVCPVVSSVGGNVELIRDRVDGLVIPPDDPRALAAASSIASGTPSTY